MTDKAAIIDVWMQHPNLNFINHDMFASLRRWMGIDKVTEEIPAEATLGVMDQAGVGIGLISSWYGPQGPLITNEEVLSLTDSFPDRFVGIASTNLYKPMEGVRELRHYVKNEGFRGLRIVQWLWNLPTTDRRYYPLFAECVELDIPVCLQVGHTGPLCPSEPGRPIPYIDEVAIDFPELKMVCGHIGYPWTEEMIAVATKHQNVVIDTSAYAAHRFPEELVRFMKTNGRKKVLFGTNYPMITPGQCLERLEKLELNDEQKALFLYENARRIFKLD